MVQSFEKINCKILTEFKLLELSEMKTEKLIAKKKKERNRETFTARRIKEGEITRI